MKGTRTRLALLAILVTSIGCAAPGARPLERGDDVRPSTPDVLDPVGRLAPGDVAVLPPGNPLGATRVYLVDEYAAASGRTCRRVALGAIEGPRRVVCRRVDGHWSATRALTRTGEMPLPGLGAAHVDEPLADELAAGSRTLGAGETLWTFAERTTGRGENWSVIAQANAIGDPDQVDAGRVLTLPPGLASRR